MNATKQHHKAKLSETDVRLIRYLFDENIPIKEIAEKFEMSPSCISDICHYKTWKHVV